MPAEGALLRVARASELKPWLEATGCGTAMAAAHEPTAMAVAHEPSSGSANVDTAAEPNAGPTEESQASSDGARAVLSEAVGFVLRGHYSSLKGHGIGTALCSAQKLSQLFQNSQEQNNELMVAVCNTATHSPKLARVSMLS